VETGEVARRNHHGYVGYRRAMRAEWNSHQTIHFYIAGDACSSCPSTSMRYTMHARKVNNRFHQARERYTRKGTAKSLSAPVYYPSLRRPPVRLNAVEGSGIAPCSW